MEDIRYVDIKKIKIMVFCKDNDDIDKYFKLFHFLLEKKVEKIMIRKEYAVMEGVDFIIDFRTLLNTSRGHRAHYVINMVQDEELHHQVALPITSPYVNIKHDPKWKEILL